MNNRLAGALAVVAVTAWMSSGARAQQVPQGQTHDHDAHHREMLQRGAQAMGFDQDRTVHHFLLYEDGGAIEVSVKEASDQANLQAVRKHLQEIAGLFKAGDFGKPALTHAQQVPGTADMTRLKDHVASMRQRVDRGDDPGLPIESEALHSIFQNYEKIHTTVETTSTGIVVTQTSRDQATVAALQQHASEVPDFVKDGMAAMHRAMMKKMSGTMPHPMHGAMMGGPPRAATAPSAR